MVGQTQHQLLNFVKHNYIRDNSLSQKSIVTHRINFMDEKKKQRLEANGWKVSGVEEFLGLTQSRKCFS